MAVYGMNTNSSAKFQEALNAYKKVLKTDANRLANIPVSTIKKDVKGGSSVKAAQQVLSKMNAYANTLLTKLDEYSTRYSESTTAYKKEDSTAATTLKSNLNQSKIVKS